MVVVGVEVVVGVGLVTGVGVEVGEEVAVGEGGANISLSDGVLQEAQRMQLMTRRTIQV